MLIIRKKQLVLINVNYFMPDYNHIIQQFIWQTEDVLPQLPRTTRFLDYWKDNIDAVINEVFISYTDYEKGGNFRYSDYIKEI